MANYDEVIITDGKGKGLNNQFSKKNYNFDDIIEGNTIENNDGKIFEVVSVRSARNNDIVTKYIVVIPLENDSC